MGKMKWPLFVLRLIRRFRASSNQGLPEDGISQRLYLVRHFCRDPGSLCFWVWGGAAGGSIARAQDSFANGSAAGSPDFHHHRRLHRDPGLAGRAFQERRLACFRHALRPPAGSVVIDEFSSTGGQTGAGHGHHLLRRNFANWQPA